MTPLTSEKIKALSNQNFVADFLVCTREELRLLRSDKLYNVFSPKDSNREIQEPTGKLKMALSILKKELAKENFPDWLMSAKGKGHIKNAMLHCGESQFGMKMDISHFYRSCKKEYIFKFFNHQDGYGLSKGVSSTLAQITTYNGHLPTGAPTSPYLAFLAYRKCFEEIFNLANAHGFKMTLYVDDLTFSFGELSYQSVGWLKRTIKQILNRYQLNIKTSKTRTYWPNEKKMITGVPVYLRTLLYPNKIQKKIHDEKLKRTFRKQARIDGLKNYLKSIDNANAVQSRL